MSNREQERKIVILREAIVRLTIAWKAFHDSLPNGEYSGLGEMRAAVTNSEYALNDTGPSYKKVKR